MIPAGVFNQGSKVNPVWYLDFRPTNAAKPLTGNMGVGWHTVNVPFDLYSPIDGDSGIGTTTVPIFVFMENLSPINGDEEISVAVLSQDGTGSGGYFMQGYMLDPTTGSTFNRSRERSLLLGGDLDIITFSFLNAGTYKMYINTNMPSSLIPTYTSSFGVFLRSGEVEQSVGAVSFSIVDRTLTSSALDDPSWYTNNVEGECVFTVGAGWNLSIQALMPTESSASVIGQIAIEKIS